MAKAAPRAEAVLYLSGPVSGMPDRNAPGFDLAEQQLHARGYRTVNPLRNGLPRDADWQDHMRTDLQDMLGCCQALVLLPGFLDSRGAMCELMLAHMLGVPAYLLHELVDPAADTQRAAA